MLTETTYDGLLDKRQAAKLIGIHERTLDLWQNQRRIPFINSAQADAHLCGSVVPTWNRFSKRIVLRRLAVPFEKRERKQVFAGGNDDDTGWRRHPAAFLVPTVDAGLKTRRGLE